MTAPFEDGMAWGETPSGALPGPYDKIGSALAGLPRPRAIRMTRRGKSTAVLVAVILMVSIALFVAGLSAQSRAQAGSTGSPQFVKFALPIVFIFLLVPINLRRITKEKYLMSEGEIAPARVTERRMGRHGPIIRYEFSTPRGEHFLRSAADASGQGQLSAGMSVPIFYDPRKPKRQLALCASFYEVVLPGER